MTNIARSRDNKAMKCGQVIEYNMRKFFLGKPYTKRGGETILRPYTKNSKLNISLDQYPKVLCSLFFLYAKLRAIRIY